MAEADPKIINVHAAKTQFSKLLKRAHAGEEITLFKAGKPYAKMVPYEPVAAKPKRKPGGWPVKGDISDSVWFDPLPEEELELWEGKRLERYGL